MKMPFSLILETLVEANCGFALVSDKLNFEPCCNKGSENKMITVKNLSQEETDIWYKINAEEKGFSGEQIKEKGNSLREKFIKSEEDPSDFFITFKDGVPMGKIYRYREKDYKDGVFTDKGLWVLQGFSINISYPEMKTEIFKSLINHIKGLPSWNEIKIMHTGSVENILEEYLISSGFSLEIRKQYFRKELKGLNTDEYEKETSIFTYKSLSQTGDDIFIRVFQNIQKDTINSNAQNDAEHPEEAFNDFKDPERFNPDIWFIAYHNDKPVGMVLPGVEEGRNPKEGFIQFIGILPEYRSRGFGKILLKKGILELCKQNGGIYIGSTDVLNVPMIKTFIHTGCNKTNIYDIWTTKNEARNTLPHPIKNL